MGRGEGEDIHLLLMFIKRVACGARWQWENMRSGPDLGLTETEGKKKVMFCTLASTLDFCRHITEFHAGFIIFFFQTLLRASHSHL